ncbi:MAG: hypothetical protein NVSMB3_04040 [Acidobacteriaceae bacterium]
MTSPLTQIAAVLLVLATGLNAQAPASKKSPAGPAPIRPSTPYLNHNLIFLDPAHGGSDSGAHLPENLLEKDLTLALANRIRSLLSGNNLAVILAREADAAPSASEDPDPPPAPAAPPTPDARAGTANHAHPVACILLHATAFGNGVHIVTSALPSPDTSIDLPPSPSRPIPWESAQTDSLPQSLRLANEIGSALARANLPVHLSRGAVKPIDSLTCPAVAIEIAPLHSGPTPVSDSTYQQRVAQAVATALLFWRGHADPPSPPAVSLNHGDAAVTVRQP